MFNARRCFYGFATGLLVAISVATCRAGENAAQETVLWRIGLKDNSSAEFTGTSFPASYTVPQDWATRTAWPDFPPKSEANPKSRSGKLDTEIHYDLAQVPKHGLVMRLKTVNSSSFVTELAVFANGLPCGILQTVGTEAWGSSGLKFGNTYQVYIPREFLQNGDNRLRIRKLGHPFNRDGFEGLSVTLDWLELAAPAAPVAEPLHSRYVRIGAAWGTFEINGGTVACEPKSWEWLGTAWCGNPIRVSFWANTWAGITHPREYLETARQYNMCTVVDYSHCMPTRRTGMPEWTDAKGELHPVWRKKLDDLLAKYGDLFQYYEVTNEPCMGITDASMAATLAVARHLHEHKPKHMKVSAPAFTYGGGVGDPKDWDLSAENRRKVEAFCDTTNGHAYGNSYAQNRGNLVETIRTFSDRGVIENGFPKEFINTEMGVVLKWHRDAENLGVKDQSNASILDRIHRAHVGFCDLFLHFTTFGPDDVRLLGGKTYEPETWVSNQFAKTGPNHDQPQDSPLSVLRRMTLAYATHGRPLPYEFVQRDEVENRLVYFRAVDTSSLAPLPGSGATSKKILLSFVNFSREDQTLRVRVTFPESGVYRGTRFGAEDQYLAAKSDLGLDASPQAVVVESLGPGESVEYILERDPALARAIAVPAAPTDLRVEGGRIGKIGFARLRWKNVAADAVCKVQRSDDGKRFLQVDEVAAGVADYEDASADGPAPGKTYFYRIKASGRGGDSPACAAVKVDIPSGPAK